MLVMKVRGGGAVNTGLILPVHLLCELNYPILVRLLQLS